MKGRALITLAPLQCAQALAGLGAIAVFTRLMSASEFGQYAIALSASMLAHTVLFTWAEAAAFRFLPSARQAGQMGNHYATLLAIALALCVLAVAGTLLALSVTGAERPVALLIGFAAGAAILRFALRLARESDRAALEVGRYATLETIYLVLGFAAGVIFLTRSDLGAAAPFAGLMVAGALVLVLDAPRLMERARGGAPSLARAASYARYGAPLAVALAIDLAVQTVARIIVLTHAGAGDVGAYAAAQGLARPLDLLFMAAGAAISPLLLTAYESRRPGALEDAARQGVTLMAAFAAPAAIGLLLVSTPLSALLVGAALSEHAARLLPWLALAGLASGFNLYYLAEAFQLTLRTGLRALVMIAPGAVQLGVTFALASQFGAAGAAIGALTGAVTGTLLLALVGRRLLALPLPQAPFTRIAAATAFMAAMIIALGDGSLLRSVVVGVSAYALAALVFDVAHMRAALGASIARVRQRRLNLPRFTHAQ